MGEGDEDCRGIVGALHCSNLTHEAFAVQEYKEQLDQCHVTYTCMFVYIVVGLYTCIYVCKMGQ